MKVTLKNHTPLWVCSDAVRTCWQSQEKSDTTDDMRGGWEDSEECGEKDKILIDRVGNKNKHASTLEHLVYNFFIEDVSRALLQEFARHRIASLSVKSTRYTLKELKDEEPFTFINGREAVYKRAARYVKLVGVGDIDLAIVEGLEKTRQLLAKGYSNDLVKYTLVESYYTDITWTINARSLQNFLRLRSDKAALWEIRDLANLIFDTLPEEHKYLFEDCMYKPQVEEV